MHRELERLMAIEQAATKGPWEAQTFMVIAKGYGSSGMIAHLGCTSDFGPTEDEPNAALIATARNALPALIAALVEIEAWAKTEHRLPVVQDIIERIITKHLGAAE